MGDNANIKWDWHNTEVGKGYQAKGVIRQSAMPHEKVKIIDASKPKVPINVEDDSSSESTSEKKKHRKEKKSKKHKKEKRSRNDKYDEDEKYTINQPVASISSVKRAKFNPMLQLIMSKLNDN